MFITSLVFFFYCLLKGTGRRQPKRLRRQQAMPSNCLCHFSSLNITSAPFSVHHIFYAVQKLTGLNYRKMMITPFLGISYRYYNQIWPPVVTIACRLETINTQLFILMLNNSAPLVVGNIEPQCLYREFRTQKKVTTPTNRVVCVYNIKYIYIYSFWRRVSSGYRLAVDDNQAFVYIFTPAPT